MNEGPYTSNQMRRMPRVSSREGITTTALKEKTGLAERQIWIIIYRAEKRGKIKKTKRGIYVAAEPGPENRARSFTIAPST